MYVIKPVGKLRKWKLWYLYYIVEFYTFRNLGRWKNFTGHKLGRDFR